MRHFATPFAYNDAAWKKYGQAFSTMMEFKDPKTKAVLSSNLMNSSDYGMTLPNFGITISSLVERGTRFAICDMATNFIAMQIAEQTGGNKEAIYKELVASAIPNGRFVPAGVVAVTRAQEYNYSLLVAG